MSERVRVEIVLPVGVEPSGHVQRYIGGRLSAAQARGLKRLWQGLKGANCELANGKRVEDGVSAVRWLLEQYGGALARAGGSEKGEGGEGAPLRGQDSRPSGDNTGETPVPPYPAQGGKRRRKRSVEGR